MTSINFTGLSKHFSYFCMRKQVSGNYYPAEAGYLLLVTSYWLLIHFLVTGSVYWLLIRLLVTDSIYWLLIRFIGYWLLIRFTGY